MLVYLSAACAASLVVTFAVSAWTKLRSRSAFGEFRTSLVAMGLMNDRRAHLVAPLVVSAEAATALMLLHPASIRWGFAAAFVLLTAFTGALAVSARRGAGAPCRCFGRTARPPGRAEVVRNTLLAIVAVTGRFAGADPEAAAPTTGLAIAVVAGGLMGVLVIAMPDIYGLFAPLPTSPRRASNAVSRRGDTDRVRDQPS
jgi:hypothetical protein